MPEYNANISFFTKWIPVKNWFDSHPLLTPVSFSSTLAACDAINREVNTNFVYVRDGISDTWLTPPEFKARGYGDCEDFSIYKMSKLIERGVPRQLMELVICFDKQSREYHCVLRVFAGTRQYILDNQHVRLLGKTSFEDRYQAIYALSLSGWRLCEEP